MTSKTGTVNNVIQVKNTDFEVFDALRIDSQDSADISGTGTCIHLVITTSRLANYYKRCSLINSGM